MNRFKFRQSTNKAFAFAASVCLFAFAAAPARSQLVPIGLPAALNYHLIGTPIVAGGVFAPPNPGVDVSLNPQPLPPFPDPGTKLDLTFPDDPVYINPSIASSYVIDFGMDAGGPVSFNVPGPTPPDPSDFSFTGMGPGGDPYTIGFAIGGGVITPGSFVELNPQPLPPFPDPGFNFVEFQFSLETAIDPTLTFQVNSGNTDYAFAQRSVPEPASFALAGVALCGLLGDADAPEAIESRCFRSTEKPKSRFV